MGIPVNSEIPNNYINTMINTFEKYYEENSVYKTLFICSCDEEVYDILNKLEDNYHSVSVLFHDDIYDERENFYTKLLDFKSTNHRIFLISYQTWALLNSEIKVFLLPYQNLITFGDLSDDGIKYINDWLYNAKICGFLEEEPRILKLNDEVN
jgi:hypothetical protein